MILVYNKELIAIDDDMEINPFEDLDLPWNEFIVSGEEFFKSLKNSGLETKELIPYLCNYTTKEEIVLMPGDVLKITTNEVELVTELISDMLIVFNGENFIECQYVKFQHINNKCIISFIYALTESLG